MSRKADMPLKNIYTRISQSNNACTVKIRVTKKFPSRRRENVMREAKNKNKMSLKIQFMMSYFGYDELAQKNKTNNNKNMEKCHCLPIIYVTNGDKP